VEKATSRPKQASRAFLKALNCDARRYDAAVELADQHLLALRHWAALELLKKYEPLLGNSPLYLDRAARIYTRMGLHARAWPLYQKASAKQPDADQLAANLAASSVLLGKIDLARSIYQDLLRKHPGHQRNHYELSRLSTASDDSHIRQMKSVLDTAGLPASQNIFIYYAIAKELEDLGHWEEAFEFYKRGGDAAAAVASTAGYQVKSDIAVIDRIIEVCDSEWMEDRSSAPEKPAAQARPVFIVGLPRTGTTLTERIISSHSQVESADETFFMQTAIRRISGLSGAQDIIPEMIDAAAKKDIRLVAKTYREAVAYRLEGLPLFIDKYPFNFLFLGFIAKAFPDAYIVHLRRNPMDACFAMFKQSFFKFAYTLEDLASYYSAYDRLRRHWEQVLGDRVIEVEYESLVSDPETQTRRLLKQLGLEFEPACLEFYENEAPSATASAVQIRETVHTRSVEKWKHWASQLQSLRTNLERSGISID
jgi:tetratricopeptide (TPR) repeat protein